MPTRTEDLKNCFLVAFKASVHGGLSYKHSDSKVETDGRREDSEWKTNKTIDDKEERNNSVALAGRIKRAVDRLGRPNELGTIVPAENEGKLDEVIEKCREDVRAFNAVSAFTNLRFTALKFYISGENEAALDDMLQDLRDTLGDLKDAIKSADFKNIRAVVAKLKGFDAVLPESAADYLQRAMADARKQATVARKALEERGKDLEEVQREMDSSTVDFARFAVMEPGDELRDVSNPLVQKLMEAQSEQRGANIMLGSEDGDDGVFPFPEGNFRQVQM
jgi:hypothetical protein